MDIVKAFNENDMEMPITIKGTFDNPLFRASDIGEILGIKIISSTIRDFDETERVSISIQTSGGEQSVTFLTEIGLYNILFISRKPIAKQFKKWVCDVIKEIRLTGNYTLQQRNQELENRLIQSNEETKESENRNKELLKEKELEKQNILLSEYSKHCSLVYIAKVKSFIDGTYVIKLGESRCGISGRFTEHTNNYDEMLLLDCFAVNRSKDFETFLHHHENVVGEKVKTLTGHTTKNELFLIGKNLTYSTLLNIINTNIKFFNDYTYNDNAMEILRLENENLKLITGMNGNDMKTFIQEIVNNNKILLGKIDNLEKSNKEILEKLNKNTEPPRTTTGFNAPLVTLGPRLQKINPETLQLIKVYETVSECMNENNKIKRPSLNKAVIENTVYNGFRWLLVDRNIDATIITTIERTVQGISHRFCTIVHHCDGYSYYC